MRHVPSPFLVGPHQIGLRIRITVVVAVVTILVGALAVQAPFSREQGAAHQSQGGIAWQDPDFAHSPPASMGPAFSATVLVNGLAQRSALSRGAVGGTWTPLGPAPYDATNFGFRAATGQVETLAYSPSRSSIYAGTPDGGLWKTTSEGANWTPLGDNFASPAVHAVAVDPAHPDTVYAGTGGPLDPHFGTVGVYKSTDGGTTWTLHGGDAFESHTSGPGAVTALVVDPTDSNRVYAAGTIGIAASTDGGITWEGLHSPFFSVDDLVIDQHGNLYAAGGEGSLSPGVEYSADHGTTWTVVSSGLPSADDVKQYGDFMKYELALAPVSATASRSSQLLYLTIGTPNTVDIYRTENGGDTWARIGSSHASPALPPGPGDRPFDQSQGHLTIGVDPSDPSGNTVFVGGAFLYKTSNALSDVPTWTNVSLGSPASTEKLHRDLWALLWVPTGSGYTLYIGCDGGVFKTSDGGQTFSDANGSLGTMQFYGGAIGPGGDPSLLLAASQDNGASFSSGTGWSGVVGGDIVSTAVSPQHPEIMYAMHHLGEIMKSVDGGRTWQEATTGIGPRSGAPAWGGQENEVTELDGARWDAPLIMDPSNPQVLYAGFHHLWKTTDGGQNWTSISPDVHPGGENDGIFSIGLGKSDPNTIYVTDGWLELWRTNDGGATWKRLSSFTESTPRSLVVDPTNSRVLYAPNSYPQTSTSPRMRVSLDGGNTWIDRSKGLPNVPFWSATISPTSSTTIFAGGLGGVYVSYDSSKHWSMLGTGLPNTLINQLVPSADGSHLFAFTYGRGVWKVTVPAAPPPAPAATATPLPRKQPVKCKKGFHLVHGKCRKRHG